MRAPTPTQEYTHIRISQRNHLGPYGTCCALWFQQAHSYCQKLIHALSIPTLLSVGLGTSSGPSHKAGVSWLTPPTSPSSATWPTVPSPSGSTALKCSLFSFTASWKCSAVFSIIQCCISLALILRSVFTSTLGAGNGEHQTRC